MIQCVCRIISDIALEGNIMDAILAFVEQLLAFFKEFDAAAVIEMVRNFLAGLAG